MIEHRIADKRMVRLIRKWLTIGELDDNGHRQARKKGIPQGSVVSPVLGNIFLHYVFDLWTHRWRKRTASGDVIVIRYADDAIVGFQHRWEADNYRRELEARLKRFGLTMHPEKTRLIEFGRFARENRRRRGVRKPETFDFLGFTHVCATNPVSGGFTVRRLTVKTRMRQQLREIKMGLRRRLHDPIREVGLWLQPVVQGHLNYYAVPGNSRRVSSFANHVSKLWFRSLRRRSQRSRMTWTRYKAIAHRFLPAVRIVHSQPGTRFDAMTRGRSPVR